MFKQGVQNVCSVDYFLNIDRLKIHHKYNKRSVTIRRRHFLPKLPWVSTPPGKKNESCQALVIPSSPTARLHPSILHPFIPLPNSHQTSDWQPSLWGFVVWENLHICTHTHTHAVIWSDAVTPRQRCRSPVLLCSDRPVLGCVSLWVCSGLQGSELHGSLNAQMWTLLDVSGQAESAENNPAHGH